MEFILRALLLIISGTLLLRLVGRKSISQMTISQTVVMISIGTLIVQPLANRSVWRALIVAGIFVLTSIFMDYLEIKFDFFERFITGRSKIVISNGNLIPQNLKQMRITVDQLEMRLRQSGINKITDVKSATIEANGQLGYELKEDAQPLTVGQFKALMKEMQGANLQSVQSTETDKPTQQRGSQNNLFTEVKTDQHQSQIPPQLH